MAFWTAIRYSSDHILITFLWAMTMRSSRWRSRTAGRENHSAAGRSETVSCEYHGQSSKERKFHDSHCAGYLPARPQHRPSHGHSAGSSKMLPYIKKYPVLFKGRDRSEVLVLLGGFAAIFVLRIRSDVKTG